MLKKISMAAALLAASTSMAMAFNFGRPVPIVPKEPPHKTFEAPEIDPSTAVAGLTLLAGGVAVMIGRRSKRLQTTA